MDSASASARTDDMRFRWWVRTRAHFVAATLLTLSSFAVLPFSVMADTCARLAGTANGAQADFAATIRKRCMPEALAALLGASGFALGERATTCNALGIPLDSIGAVADCVGRVQACRIDQVVETRTPRLQELLRLIE